ncbi:hypothetical protein ABD76_22360 [Paenibacillus dendritiformis]|nr:hypothetical protein [Paenibacillus dendritiformis]
MSLRGIGNVFRPRAAMRYRLRRANAAPWLQGELRLVLAMRSRHHKKPPDTYGFAMPFLSRSREGTAIFIALFEEEYGC